MKGPHSSGPWTALFVSFCHKVHAWAPTVSHHRNAFSQASTIQVAWNPCHPTVRTVLTSSRYTATKPTLIYRYLSTTGGDTFPSFQVGDKIQVEVISFGPLGASVGVVGIGHGDSVPLLPVDAEPYATGLILQQEIAYFRQSRGNVDVVRGEVLPAYIQKIRYVVMVPLYCATTKS